jgi:hypothetical protein
VCKTLNGYFGWEPETSECMVFNDICEYWNIFQYKYKLEYSSEHNLQEYIDNCIYTREIIVELSEERLKEFVRKTKGYMEHR